MPVARCLLFLACVYGLVADPASNLVESAAMMRRSAPTVSATREWRVCFKSEKLSSVFQMACAGRSALAAQNVYNTLPLGQGLTLCA